MSIFKLMPSFSMDSTLPAFSIDLAVKRTAALLTAERQFLSHLIKPHQPLCISGYWAA
jgi:hypothetical protein